MQHLPFGAFNPRFYGVSIFFGSDDRVDAWDRYGKAADLAAWARNAEPGLLNDTSTVSAIEHEMRHFHDFLVSPLSTTIMGLRMQATINGFQALKTLTECRGRFVPVPLSRWMTWDQSARQRWIESTGSFFGIKNLDDMVELPHADVADLKSLEGTLKLPDALAPEDEFSVYALGAAQAYASMGSLRQRRVSKFDMDVSADDVFEAAAHLVQMQACWTGQGQAAAESFLDFVLTSSANHLQPLQVLWLTLQKSENAIGLQRVTELVTWMLLGSWEAQSSSGHPANRYFQVLELAALSPEEDVFIGQMPTEHLFDRLDVFTGNPAWKRNVASASAAADRRRDRYATTARTLKGGFFDDLFGVAAAWHDDQDSAKQTFLSDPASLAHPLRYLTENRFPLAFVETRCGGNVHQRTHPLKSDNHRAITVDSEGKQVLSYISKLDPGQSAAELDRALSARILTHMVDFLFSDEPALDLYDHWCRSQIQELTGKQLVSVY